MFSEGSEVGLETFELKPSLWKLISDTCPLNEAEEIKRILGASLVEQACDLYEEASSLLDIWRIAREDTDTEMNEHHHNSNSRLPEPPNVRERLLQEIHFFIGYLKEKNEKQFTSNSAPSFHKSSAENVLEYVTKMRVKRGTAGSGGRGSSRGSSGSGSRPMSGVSSRDGRETPLRGATPGSQSDEGSQLSLLSDKVESIDEHMNATDIDQVVEHLRHVLSEECDQRRDDIDFLQKCLDEEQEFRTSVSKPEPTLQELREFSSQLEKEILEGSTVSPPLPSVTSPSHHPRPPLLPAIPHPPPPSQNTRHQRTFKRASKVKKSSISSESESIQPSSEKEIKSADSYDHTNPRRLQNHPSCRDPNAQPLLSPPSRQTILSHTSTTASSSPNYRTNSHKTPVCNPNTRNLSAPVSTSTYQQSGVLKVNNSKSQSAKIRESLYGKPIT